MSKECQTQLKAWRIENTRNTYRANEKTWKMLEGFLCIVDRYIVYTFYSTGTCKVQSQRYIQKQLHKYIPSV